MIFKVVVTQKENGMDNMVFWPAQNLCKEMKMQCFHFDERYATRRRKHSSLQMHNVPKKPKTMQFRYFKWKLVSLPKSKNAFIFFVWLWRILKVNTKPSMLHYFQSGERVLCRCKRHKEKGLQTKHALNAMRYERKQVETCSNKK